MTKSESTRDAICRLTEQKGSLTGPELADELGISRQAVSLQLRRLIAEGAIFKTGSTRAARYMPGHAAPDARNFKRTLDIEGLDESTVYEKVAVALNLATLPDNVEAIAHYAFTEMISARCRHFCPTIRVQFGECLSVNFLAVARWTNFNLRSRFHPLSLNTLLVIQ